MDSLSIICIAVGILVIVRRGPLIFAPSATLRFYDRWLLSTNARFQVLPPSTVAVQSLTYLHARFWAVIISVAVLSSTRPTHREETELSQSHVFVARKRRVQTHHPLRILQNHGRETAPLPVRPVRTHVLDDQGHPLLPSPAPENDGRHGRHTPRRGGQPVGDRPNRTTGLEHRRPLARAGRFGVSSI